MGDSIVATQPTVQYIRCPGCESPQEYHLPAMTSSPHPFPTTPAVPQIFPQSDTSANISV